MSANALGIIVGIIVVTGRAHCQRQVAFFLIFLSEMPQILIGEPFLSIGPRNLFYIKRSFKY